METAGELRREVVEDVSRVTAAGQQHQRSARAAPIEHFESHVLSDRDESAPVRRGVFPASRLLCLKRSDNRDEQRGNRRTAQYTRHSAASWFDEHLRPPCV